MRTRMTLTVVLAVAFAGGGRAAAGDTALVDVAEVLRQHTSFVVGLEELKTRAGASSKALQARASRLKRMKEELQEQTPGSDQRRRQELRVQQEAAALQSDIEDQRRRLKHEEALLYADAYEEVLAAVAEVARERRYSLVLRYQRDPIDRTSSESILQHLNRGVLFQRDCDITEAVIRQLRGGGSDAGSEGGSEEAESSEAEVPAEASQ